MSEKNRPEAKVKQGLQKTPMERAQRALGRLVGMEDRHRSVAGSIVRETLKCLQGESLDRFVTELAVLASKHLDRVPADASTRQPNPTETQGAS